jgi:hypothetical protein
MGTIVTHHRPFDYTTWRKSLLKDLSIEEISARAMAYVAVQESQSAGAAADE